MDPSYAARYRRLYEQHWWWRAREAVVLPLLTSLAAERRGGFGTILDIGCGDGLFFEQLERLGTPEGIEPDPSLVTDRGRARGPITVAPFDRAFETETRYGLVVMLDVLEHLDDPVGALRHIRSLLAKDGRLVITVPAFRLLWTGHDELNRHRTRYTRGMLLREAAAAGLEVERSRYLFQWLWPVKLLVRLRESLVSTPPQPADVPSAWLNRTLYGWCRLEERSWGRLPWPFGTTLIAVLRADRSVADLEVAEEGS